MNRATSAVAPAAEIKRVMTGAARPNSRTEDRRRPRLAWWGYSLVAAMVMAVVTAVFWALGAASTPVARPVVDPSVPALPLPTFVGTTPRSATASEQSTPTASVSASPTDASPSPDTSEPSAEPGSTASGGPASAPTGSAPPEVAELTPLPAEQAQGLRSVGNGAHTSVEFVNERAEQVTVYWLNHWGFRIRVTRLASGQSHHRDTQVGHSFVVTDQGGRALVVFKPVAEPARAVIR